MVRNRPNGTAIVKWLSDKAIGAILLASAIAIWLIVIIAITFLMIDNGRLKDSLRLHDADIEASDLQHGNLSTELAKVKSQVENLEIRIKSHERRLKSLEKSSADQP